jgi:hypothetical protein
MWRAAVGITDPGVWGECLMDISSIVIATAPILRRLAQDIICYCAITWSARILLHHYPHTLLMMNSNMIY